MYIYFISLLKHRTEEGNGYFYGWIETHCIDNKIPLDKLNDIALNHYRRVESQRLLKNMKHVVQRKDQGSAVKKTTLYFLNFHLIFPEIPEKFVDLRVSMLSGLDGEIPQANLKLWKQQREFRLKEMINQIPVGHSKLELFKAVC